MFLDKSLRERLAFQSINKEYQKKRLTNKRYKKTILIQIVFFFFEILKKCRKNVDFFCEKNIMMCILFFEFSILLEGSLWKIRKKK